MTIWSRAHIRPGDEVLVLGTVTPPKPGSTLGPCVEVRGPNGGRFEQLLSMVTVVSCRHAHVKGDRVKVRNRHMGTVKALLNCHGEPKAQGERTASLLVMLDDAKAPDVYDPNICPLAGVLEDQTHQRALSTKGEVDDED